MNEIKRYIGAVMLFQPSENLGFCLIFLIILLFTIKLLWMKGIGENFIEKLDTKLANLYYILTSKIINMWSK